MRGRSLTTDRLWKAAQPPGDKAMLFELCLLWGEGGESLEYLCFITADCFQGDLYFKIFFEGERDFIPQSK